MAYNTIQGTDPSYEETKLGPSVGDFKHSLKKAKVFGGMPSWSDDDWTALSTLSDKKKTWLMENSRKFSVVNAFDNM